MPSKSSEEDGPSRRTQDYNRLIWRLTDSWSPAPVRAFKKGCDLTEASPIYQQEQSGKAKACAKTRCQLEEYSATFPRFFSPSAMLAASPSASKLAEISRSVDFLNLPHRFVSHKDPCLCMRMLTDISPALWTTILCLAVVFEHHHKMFE